VHGIKKIFVPIVMILCGMSAGILIASVIYALTGFMFFGGTQRPAIITEEPENAEMTSLAFNILGYIKDDDFISLSNVVHPEYGVVISPYATVNLSTNQRFSADEIAALGTNTHTYMWGVYNGSGEPIALTPTEYFSKFIPAAEFLGDTIVGINQIVRRGNALDNITDEFPNVRFIDFHLPGDDLDWSSLRFGFEEYEGHLRLTVIVYNTWAI